jgi:hypothetical protein
MATTNTVNANVTVKFVINEKGNPPGKLADAELHFTDGVLAGLKLIGFAVWERRSGGGRNVSARRNRRRRFAGRDWRGRCATTAMAAQSGAPCTSQPRHRGTDCRRILEGWEYCLVSSPNADGPVSQKAIGRIQQEEPCPAFRRLSMEFDPKV